MSTANLPISADTTVQDTIPTTNYSSQNYFACGESATGAYVFRSMLKPDYSGMPAMQIITAATLYITPIIDDSNNARTLYVHRILKSINYSQATHNVYSTGSNWDTAGCSNSTSDYDGSIVIGSASIPASPTLNTAIAVPLDANEIQKFYDGTYTNNGLLLFVDTQNADEIIYASKDHATAGYRPYMAITFINNTRQVVWF